jgi:hypothetical protein
MTRNRHRLRGGFAMHQSASMAEGVRRESICADILPSFFASKNGSS